MIRAMTAEDVGYVAQLEKVCFSNAPWQEETFSLGMSLPISHYFVYEEEGEIAGYFCGTILFEDAEVQNVATAPKFRQKGIGQALMEFFENTAKEKGAENCFLEVRVGNSPARSLYEKRGYEQIGIRKKYYPDGEDALVMKKSL